MLPILKLPWYYTAQQYGSILDMASLHTHPHLPYVNAWRFSVSLNTTSYTANNYPWANGVLPSWESGDVISLLFTVS
jgi:hypothetical protein